MAGLPKIALARLKAKHGPLKLSGLPVEPGAFQGTDHPDANLIAAFLEKTLTQKERTQVLNHLVECAECREVAALSVPAEVLEAEPIRGAAKRPWRLWPLVPWGGVAAVLGGLAVVFVLHPGMWNKRLEISRNTLAPLPAGKLTIGPPPAPAPSSPPTPEASPAGTHLHTRKSADNLAVTEQAQAFRQDHAGTNQVASVQAKRRAALMTGSRPPVRMGTEDVPRAFAERKESLGRVATTASAPAALPLSAPAAGGPVAASDEAEKSTVELQAQAKLFRATASSGAVAGGKAGAGATQAAQAAPATALRGTSRMMAQANVGSTRALHKVVETSAVPVAVLWNVSPDGTVQRSTSGKSWEQVHVAGGIAFRAIAALGNDVWAGGTGGALFHSGDRGATWARVDISFEGNALTDTITGLQSSDAQHLTITTASGTQWVTEDGGLHWQKQP